MKLKKFLALLLALTTVFALAACGGVENDEDDKEEEGSYKDALVIYQRYLKGDIDEDMLSKTCPPEIIASFAKEYPFAEGKTPGEIYKDIVDNFDRFSGTSTLGVTEITSATVTVNSEKKLSKDDLEYLKKTYTDNGIEFKLTDGYTVDCTINTTTSWGEDTYTESLTVLKIDGVWYCRDSWYFFEDGMIGDFYW